MREGSCPPAAGRTPADEENLGHFLLFDFFLNQGNGFLKGFAVDLFTGPDTDADRLVIHLLLAINNLVSVLPTGIRSSLCLWP